MHLSCHVCDAQPHRDTCVLSGLWHSAHQRESHLCSAQLPVYVPSEAEAADPVLYAGNVRAYMVRARSLLCTWEICHFQRLAVCMSLTPRAHVGSSCGMRPGWKPATPPWPTSARTTSSCWARCRPRRATMQPSHWTLWDMRLAAPARTWSSCEPGGGHFLVGVMLRTDQ